MKQALVKLSLALVLAPAAIICAQSNPTSAESGFMLEEPLRYTFPVPGNPADELSFFIYSKGEQISDADVQVREIKDPNGLSLGRDKLTASLENKVVTQDGARVTLKPDKSLFTSAGDYRVILLIVGKAGNQPVKSLTTITINHPAADINLDELKDQTIELERSFPGGEALGTYTIYLQEITGKAPVKDLQIRAQVQPIYVKDSKILVPGSVKVTPQFIKPDDSPSDKEQGQWALVVNISGVRRAGNLTSQLRLTSPSFEGSKAIPLNINVTDRWGFPLFVIFLGVLGGFLTNYLVEDWKPRQLNRYKLVQLRAIANRYRSLVLEQEKVAKIHTAQEELNKAEEENNEGNTAGAKTRLEQVEKELKDFQKAEIKQQAALYDESSKLKAEIEQYGTSLPGLTPEETSKLNAILADLNRGQIEGLLEEDKIDEAARRLKQSQTKFTGFKKERLNRDLESLKSQLMQLGTVSESLKAKKEAIEQKISETETLISGGDIDSARVNLDQIERDIKALDQQLPKGAKASSDVIPRTPLLSKQAESAAAERTRLLILEQPSIRTTGSYLQFKVEDTQGLIQDGDILRWDFRDGGKIIKRHVVTISHLFDKSGRYDVKVDILRGPAEETVKVLTLPVTILPGQTEIALGEISGNIQRSNILISVIALVLAALTGLIYLYIGSAFGSLKDYLLALLWGFGIDNSVRGFAAVLKKATGLGA